MTIEKLKLLQENLDTFGTLDAEDIQDLIDFVRQKLEETKFPR